MPRSRSQGIVIALLLGTLALIVYGSLYPFNLTPGAQTETIAQAITELSWARAGRGDHIANVLLYAPLGFCLMFWLDGRLRRSAAAITTIAIGTALSFCIEVSQVFIEQRVPSWWDVVLNSSGTIAGMTAGITWHELGGRMSTARSNSGRVDRSAVVVLLLWLAWRFAPFGLLFSLSKLKSAFAPLTDPYFSTLATIHYWVWWTLMAHIVFALTSAQRGTEALLALIAVVLTSCLLVASHTFVPSELLALMLLLPTLYLFDRLAPAPRHTILLVSLVAVFLYDSFFPFRIADSFQGFDAWPFMAWIDKGFPIDWQWLTRRACYFAALVWVMKETGFALKTTVAVIPFTVLILELVQMWLLGQNASITEPALAFGMAWTLRWLDDSDRSMRVTRLRAHNR